MSDKTKEPKEKEVTLDGLIQSAKNSEENAKALFFKQQGVREFLQSVKNDGFELVRNKK